MASSVREKAIDESPLPSGPSRKRIRHSTIGPTTPSGENVVDVSDAFSRLEVTPRRKTQSRKRLSFTRARNTEPERSHAAQMEPEERNHAAQMEAGGECTSAEQNSTQRQKKMPTWSIEEVQSLLMFMMFHTDGSHWVEHKDIQFWGAAGKFIHTRTSLPCRSGTITIHICMMSRYLQFHIIHLAMACRSKVLRRLAKKFHSPIEAERFYCPREAPTALPITESSMLPSEALEGCKELITNLSDEEKMPIIIELFC